LEGIRKKCEGRSTKFGKRMGKFKMINSPLPDPLLQERELMQTEGVFFQNKEFQPHGGVLVVEIAGRI
jgi:hypothetical protein